MELIWTLQSFDLYALLDILLIAFLLFGLSFLFRGTQAVPVLRGTLVVVIATILLSTIPNLAAFRWLSGILLTGAAVAIPIIFQPEIRRAMERLGRAGFVFRPHINVSEDEIINAITTAAERLSERRHGALIVIERNDPLDEFIQTGVQLDASITPQLMLTIFFPKTELHDGAIIIRDDRVVCAAAVLPLSAAHGLSQRKIGTRHRASLGMTEVSDAIVVVVSEETGQISVANSGKLIRRIDGNRLANLLDTFYDESREPRENKTIWETLQSYLERWRSQPDEESEAAA